jgi:hypothetical protein
MDSYNENLHSVIVDVLQSHDLQIRQSEAAANVAKLTLYYAKEAKITAAEQLKEAKITLAKKNKVKEQAVNVNSLNINIFSAAMQSAQFVKQSVNNTAVCAANVQVAANAIVKLASDIGSIFSIVHAADDKTDVYQLASEVRSIINETAYEAEKISQQAMKASVATAEISAATVLEKAKNTGILVKDLLKIVSDENEMAVNHVTDTNLAMSTADTAEKMAKGIYQQLSIDCVSAKQVYNSASKQMNTNLVVSDIFENRFTVNFNLIKPAFAAAKQPPYYSVNRYIVLVVKDSAKSTFSISIAENLLQNEDRYVMMDLFLASKGAGNPLRPGPICQVINLKKMSSLRSKKRNLILKDTDGEVIKPGIKYTLFLMAIFSDEYKKKLNNFNDYLSAPSASFQLPDSPVTVNGSSI